MVLFRVGFLIDSLLSTRLLLLGRPSGCELRDNEDLGFKKTTAPVILVDRSHLNSDQTPGNGGPWGWCLSLGEDRWIHATMAALKVD